MVALVLIIERVGRGSGLNPDTKPRANHSRSGSCCRSPAAPAKFAGQHPMPSLRERLVIESPARQGSRKNRCWARCRSMMRAIGQCMTTETDAVTYAQMMALARRADPKPATGALTYDEVGAVWCPYTLCRAPKLIEQSDQSTPPHQSTTPPHHSSSAPSSSPSS